MGNLHMMEEIKRQGHLKKTAEAVENALIQCGQDIKNHKIGRVIITGSGDSYYIGLCARLFFEELCPTCSIEVLSSMEFSKYGLHKADGKTAVIAISISGNVLRTIECVEQAQHNGAYVIGITNNRQSRLAQVAKCPVCLDLDTEPTWTCGTLTYTGSLYALARTALALSPLKSPVVQARLDQLNSVLTSLEDVIRESEPVCRAAARNMRIIGNQPPVLVLGAGPNLGTAKYGAAKFAEICSTLAIGQECEEFCHGEFWVVERANLVFVIAPSGKGFSRTVEVADILRRFGCDLFILSDDASLCTLGKFSVLMPSCDEALSPLAYAIPFQLISYYYSYEKGLNPDTRDHTDPFRKECSRLLTRGKNTVL